MRGRWGEGGLRLEAETKKFKSLVHGLRGIVWFWVEFWTGILSQHSVQSRGVYSNSGLFKDMQSQMRTSLPGVPLWNEHKSAYLRRSNPRAGLWLDFGWGRLWTEYFGDESFQAMNGLMQNQKHNINKSTQHRPNCDCTIRTSNYRSFEPHYIHVLNGCCFSSSLCVQFINYY